MAADPPGEDEEPAAGERERDPGRESRGVTLGRLRPAKPGETALAWLYLIALTLGPLLAGAVAIHFGVVDIDAAVSFAADLGFLGVWLGRLWVASLIGLTVYSFARLTGIRFLAGVVNFADALLDGYRSPRLRVDESEGGDDGR